MGSESASQAERIRHTRQAIRSLTLLTTDNEYAIGTSGGPGTVANNMIDYRKKSTTGDVCICVSGELHLGPEITTGVCAKVKSFSINPRRLGYACRQVMAEHSDSYDMFCFIEDDTEILDPDFFAKFATLHSIFGENKVFLPNRYETFSQKDLAWRVYLDSPLPPHYQISSDLDGEEELIVQQFTGSVTLRRTANLHSGCYVITRHQLKWWMKQSDFNTPTHAWASAMDMMEAAQVPLGGHFPAYKPTLENGTFLSVHHVPERACHAKTPAHLLSSQLQIEFQHRKTQIL